MPIEYEIRSQSVVFGETRHTIDAGFSLDRCDTLDHQSVRIVMTGGTADLWGFKWEESGVIEPEAAKLLSHLGFEAIMNELQAGKMPKDFIDVAQYGTTAASRTKECRFQETRDTKLLCSIAVEDDRSTTRDICSRCEMPHELLVCCELANPKTRYSPDDSEGKTRRLLDAECKIRKDPGTWADCIPGGNDCWVKRVKLSE